MKLLFVLSLIGAICAQYAQEQPSYQAPSGGYPSGGYYPFPHHHHHYSSSSSSGSRSRSRSSSSESRSDSSESHEHHHHNHCKKKCDKIKVYTNETISNLRTPDIRYVATSKNGGCKNAFISCPFDDNAYYLGAANSYTDYQILAVGQLIEREVKCINGKWHAKTTTSNDYVFKYTTCFFAGKAPPTELQVDEFIQPNVNIVDGKINLR